MAGSLISLNDTELDLIQHKSMQLVPDEYSAWALHFIKKHISHNSACWGLRTEVGEFDFFASKGLNVQKFWEGYQAVAHLDPSPEALAADPGSVCVVETGELELPKYKEFSDWAYSLNLYQSMSVSSVNSTTKAVQGIVLFRGKNSPAYSDEDKRVLKELSGPLFDGLRQGREFDIKRKLFNAWSDTNFLCTVTHSGAILDMEEQFLREIIKLWPNWEGPYLPKKLQALILNERPDYKIRINKLLVRSTPYDNCILLVMTRLGIVGELTKRQYEIAELYAMGKTTKQIAASLSRETHTIENHRKNIYERLQIKSNNELTRHFDVARSALDLEFTK